MRNNDNRIYEPYQIKSKEGPEHTMKINYYDGNNGRMENKGNNNYNYDNSYNNNSSNNNKTNQIWANLVTHASSFESARI